MSQHSSQSPLNKNMSRGDYEESTSYSKGGSSKKNLSLDWGKACGGGKITSKDTKPNANKVACFGKVYAEVSYSKMKDDKSEGKRKK